MYREQLQLSRQPFQDTIDTAFFYSGGRRREIVDEIKQSLSRSVPLLVLTGEEGSGKTMICRMVEKELPVDLASVFLPKTIDSYDDMVSIVAQEINIAAAGDDNMLGTKELLQEIVDKLEERGQRLVVVFDEAEKIFLATLERIRKLLDQLNGENIYFQILLSGNHQLKDNLQQLSIVSFQEAEERYFELDQLNSDATWTYVNYCVKVASGKTIEFFSRDVAQKIAEGALGNFRKINQIAQEYLQTEKLDSSFMSLLDDLKEDPGKKRRKSRPERKSRISAGGLDSTPEYLNFSKIVPKWVYYAAGVCVVLLFLYLFAGGSGEQEVVKEDDFQEVPVIVLKEVEPLEPKITKEQSGKTPSETVGTPTEKPTQEVKKPTIPDKSEEVKTVGKVVEEKLKPESVPLKKKTEEASSENIVYRKQNSEETDSRTKPVQDQGKTKVDISSILDKSVEHADNTFEQLVSVQPKTEKTTAESEKKLSSAKDPKKAVVDKDLVAEAQGSDLIRTVKQSRPPDPVKILTEGQKKKPVETIAGQDVAGTESVSQKQGASTGSDEEIIFKERLAAGARWLVGGGTDNYTVQLMVLTSDSAEENLKNMLKTPEYKGIANYLYVLRRIGAVSTVMVFYGEYPSLIAARNARNNLPVFLRKHHPYAISIHGAVEKANSVQQQL